MNNRAIILNKKWSKELQWDRAEVMLFVLTDYSVLPPIDFSTANRKNQSFIGSKNGSIYSVTESKSDAFFVEKVAAWQSNNGLTGKNADGIIGPNTLAKMLKVERFKRIHFERIGKQCYMPHFPSPANSSKSFSILNGTAQGIRRLNDASSFYGSFIGLIRELLDSDWFLDLFSDILKKIHKGNMDKVMKSNFLTGLIAEIFLKRVDIFSKIKASGIGKMISNLKISKIFRFPVFDIIDMVEVGQEVYTGKWDTHSILNFWLAATGIAVTIEAAIVATAAAAGTAAVSSALIIAIGLFVIAIYKLLDPALNLGGKLDKAFSLNNR